MNGLQHIFNGERKYSGNKIIFPEAEQITVKKAREVNAFRNKTKFVMFLISCRNNKNFSSELIAKINDKGYQKMLDCFMAKIDWEFSNEILDELSKYDHRVIKLYKDMIERRKLENQDSELTNDSSATTVEEFIL